MPMKIHMGGFNFLNFCPTKNSWLCQVLWLCSDCVHVWKENHRHRQHKSHLEQHQSSKACWELAVLPSLTGSNTKDEIFSLPVKSKQQFLTDKPSEHSSTLNKCTTLMLSCQKRPHFRFTLILNGISLLHPQSWQHLRLQQHPEALFLKC